jgi:hypothetical protein
MKHLQCSALPLGYIAIVMQEQIEGLGIEDYILYILVFARLRLKFASKKEFYRFFYKLSEALLLGETFPKLEKPEKLVIETFRVTEPDPITDFNSII